MPFIDEGQFSLAVLDLTVAGGVVGDGGAQTFFKVYKSQLLLAATKAGCN